MRKTSQKQRRGQWKHLHLPPNRTLIVFACGLQQGHLCVCVRESVWHIVEMPYIAQANETKRKLNLLRYGTHASLFGPTGARAGAGAGAGAGVAAGNSCSDMAAAHGEPYWLDKAHRHEPAQSEPEVQPVPLPNAKTCEILKQISIVFDMCDTRLNARIILMYGLACVWNLVCVSFHYAKRWLKPQLIKALWLPERCQGQRRSHWGEQVPFEPAMCTMRAPSLHVCALRCSALLYALRLVVGSAHPIVVVVVAVVRRILCVCENIFKVLTSLAEQS